MKSIKTIRLLTGMCRRSRRPRVYISGPITLPDTPDGQRHNFDQAARADLILKRNGLATYNPMLSMFFPWKNELSLDDWLDNDLPWVDVSAAVLRLPGKSVGADREVQHAVHKAGVPVYYEIQDLIDDKENWL